MSRKDINRKRHNENKEKITKALERNPDGLQVGELEDKTGLSHTTINKCNKELIEEGKIKKERQGKGKICKLSNEYIKQKDVKARFIIDLINFTLTPTTTLKGDSLIVNSYLGVPNNLENVESVLEIKEICRAFEKSIGYFLNQHLSKKIYESSDTENQRFLWKIWNGLNDMFFDYNIFPIDYDKVQDIELNEEQKDRIVNLIEKVLSMSPSQIYEERKEFLEEIYNRSGSDLPIEKTY